MNDRLHGVPSDDLYRREPENAAGREMEAQDTFASLFEDTSKYNAIMFALSECLYREFRKTGKPCRENGKLLHLDLTFCQVEGKSGEY